MPMTAALADQDRPSSDDPDARPAPQGPLQLVMNEHSGAQPTSRVRETLVQALQAAGRRHEVVLLTREAPIARLAHTAALRARDEGGAVVAVGGDGTVNAVAQAAFDAGCPMGVVPQGTFNYFARTHGIPLAVEEAAAILLQGRLKPAQTALVNGRVCLVNASLGLYPLALEDRESFQRTMGRSPWNALLAGVWTLLRAHRQWTLLIDLEGRRRRVRTPTLFVGNNRLQMERVGLEEAAAPARGRIAAVMLKPVGSLTMLWLLLRGALGTLGSAAGVESFEFERMVVRPGLPYGPRRAKVAIDGEVCWLRAPLEFRVAPRPLWLISP